MSNRARILAPPLRTYRGHVTDPARWATWVPRQGDILVCTPPKCGTTWTQTILTMLAHGRTDLPDKVPVLSPWVDANLGVPAEQVEAALSAQAGRRVVKTHTPADGFPIWEGVTVIAVYRHPLDVFFSLRKHAANTAKKDADDPMLLPMPDSFRAFFGGGSSLDDFDRDTLGTVITHYRETACTDRVPGLKLFHYADMCRDGRQTVERLARAAGIEAGADLINKVAEATAFAAMKANAANFAPVAGTGYWKSDANFFDSASSRKWEGQLSDGELDYYRSRLEELVPDRRERAWLEHGGQSTALD